MRTTAPEGACTVRTLMSAPVRLKVPLIRTVTSKRRGPGADALALAVG